jgi:hypothetical protein
MAAGARRVDDACGGLSMMKTVVFFLAALGAAERVEACLCVDPSPCARFRSADVVFVGRVLQVRRSPESDLATFRMSVLRAGKGLTRGQVIEVRAGDARSTCSLDAVPGERWMIYAQRAAGVLTTHRCSATRLAADEPLPSLPPQPGSVAGVATTENEAGEQVGLAGVAVVIDTEERRISTRTSRDGRFVLRDVPPGRHTLRVDVPPGQSAEADVGLASARECVYEHVSAGPGGGLVGRLVDASGAALADVLVRAKAAEADGTLPEHAGAHSTGRGRTANSGWSGSSRATTSSTSATTIRRPAACLMSTRSIRTGPSPPTRVPSASTVASSGSSRSSCARRFPW